MYRSSMLLCCAQSDQTSSGVLQRHCLCVEIILRSIIQWCVATYTGYNIFILFSASLHRGLSPRLWLVNDLCWAHIQSFRLIDCLSITCPGSSIFVHWCIPTFPGRQLDLYYALLRRFAFSVILAPRVRTIIISCACSQLRRFVI